MPCRCFIVVALTLAGCSAPRINTTRLGSADLIAMTDGMAESLVASDALAERSPDSPHWVVTLDRVHNRTNEIIPTREKWAFMARLRSQLAQVDTLRERGIRFVLPAERAAALDHSLPGDARADRLAPTHALTATFHALTTATRDARTDTYVCAFQLLDLRNDELIWEDRYEVKRAVLKSKLD